VQQNGAAIKRKRNKREPYISGRKPKSHSGATPTKKNANFSEYSRELQIDNFSSPIQNLYLKRLPPWLSESFPPGLYAVYAEYLILPKLTKLEFSSGRHIHSRQRSPGKEVEFVSGGQEMVE
jgi:hypothetical protein